MRFDITLEEDEVRKKLLTLFHENGVKEETLETFEYEIKSQVNETKDTEICHEWIEKGLYSIIMESYVHALQKFVDDGNKEEDFKHEKNFT